MIKKFNIFFLTFFMIGKIKFAPGTLASLLTSILFFIFVGIFNISYFILLITTLLILGYSFISLNNSFDKFNDDDPQEIVIDEVVGQMFTLLAIPIYETLYPLPIIYYCISAFLLFRLLDIFKPFPIGYVDDNVKGSLGIMLDDILASIFTVIILIIIFFVLGG